MLIVNQREEENETSEKIKKESEMIVGEEVENIKARHQEERR